jgi:hypothetical protein
MDPEKLAEMRANADEIREDLERRQHEDPFLDMPELTREAPAIVHKTRYAVPNENRSAGPAAPLGSDEIAEVVAETLAEEGDEIRREFEARIAKL